MIDVSRAPRTIGSRPRLVGVGVGPGDPELLTLKAARTIGAADVVFAPSRRAGTRSLALAIAAGHLAPERQRIVTLPFPDRETGSSWDDAARTVADALRPDRLGVFLTEGDPLLFGSFADVAGAVARIAPEIAVETVPGVSSVTAAAAAAGVGLVDRDERLAVVPATGDPAAIEAALRDFDCVVLLKVGSVLADTLDLLGRLEILKHAVYVRRCGQPEQQIVADARALVADPPTDYFALLIVRQPSAATVDRG